MRALAALSFCVANMSRVEVLEMRDRIDPDAFRRRSNFKTNSTSSKHSATKHTERGANKRTTHGTKHNQTHKAPSLPDHGLERG